MGKPQAGTSAQHQTDLAKSDVVHGNSEVLAARVSAVLVVFIVIRSGSDGGERWSLTAEERICSFRRVTDDYRCVPTNQLATETHEP